MESNRSANGDPKIQSTRLCQNPCGSHVIVLNAADLGFRPQPVHSLASKAARRKNPIVYTYLENYPVNPFCRISAGHSGFPIKTGFPTQAEATAAIQSAVNRPFGSLTSCSTGDTVLKCSIQRIATSLLNGRLQRTTLLRKTRYGNYVEPSSSTTTLPRR